MCYTMRISMSQFGTRGVDGTPRKCPQSVKGSAQGEWRGSKRFITRIKRGFEERGFNEGSVTEYKRYLSEIVERIYTILNRCKRKVAGCLFRSSRIDLLPRSINYRFVRVRDIPRVRRNSNHAKLHIASDPSEVKSFTSLHNYIFS